MSGVARLQGGSRSERARSSHQRRALSVATCAGVYAVWVAATFVLEGHTRLLQRFDPAGRAAYALVANVGVGILLAFFAARANGVTGNETLRTRRPWPPAVAVLLTFAIGSGFAVLLAPPSARDPIVLLNAFTQVLPTSIAEVAVCWLLIGGTVQVLAMRSWGSRWTATLLAIVVADVAFALYHVAHSPPFNEPRMMLFLAVPGLVIGALVHVLRNVGVAIVAQSFFAVLGMVENLDASAFRRPFVWAYAIALVSVVVFIVALAKVWPRPAT